MEPSSDSTGDANCPPNQQTQPFLLSETQANFKAEQQQQQQHLQENPHEQKPSQDQLLMYDINQNSAYHNLQVTTSFNDHDPNLNSLSTNRIQRFPSGTKGLFDKFANQTVEFPSALISQARLKFKQSSSSSPKKNNKASNRKKSSSTSSSRYLNSTDKISNRYRIYEGEIKISNSAPSNLFVPTDSNFLPGGQETPAIVTLENNDNNVKELLSDIAEHSNDSGNSNCNKEHTEKVNASMQPNPNPISRMKSSFSSNLQSFSSHSLICQPTFEKGSLFNIEESSGMPIYRNNSYGHRSIDSFPHITVENLTNANDGINKEIASNCVSASNDHSRSSKPLSRHFSASATNLLYYQVSDNDNSRSLGAASPTTNISDSSISNNGIDASNIINHKVNININIDNGTNHSNSNSDNNNFDKLYDSNEYPHSAFQNSTALGQSKSFNSDYSPKNPGLINRSRSHLTPKRSIFNSTSGNGLIQKNQSFHHQQHPVNQQQQHLLNDSLRPTSSAQAIRRLSIDSLNTARRLSISEDVSHPQHQLNFETVTPITALQGRCDNSPMTSKSSDNLFGAKFRTHKSTPSAFSTNLTEDGNLSGLSKHSRSHSARVSTVCHGMSLDAHSDIPVIKTKDPFGFEDAIKQLEEDVELEENIQRQNLNFSDGELEDIELDLVLDLENDDC